MLSPVDEGHAPAPVIFGLSGAFLTTEERQFFADANPLGFILFGRNVEDPDQIKALTSDLRDCVGRDAPILIDQEGGRVRRLRPPHWTDVPSARAFGDLYATDPQKAMGDLAAAMNIIADEVLALGITVDCAPVLDLGFDETHSAVRDRTYSYDPTVVVALGRIVCETLAGRGVVPVMKHIPGHGRAVVDSHHDLPVILASPETLAASDFIPFRAMLGHAFAEGLWGMVAHVTYAGIDSNLPATCSRKIIHDVIRKGIGFQGLLLTDDIDMGALSFIGDAGKRAEQALRAGCDVVLQCNGKMDDMKRVAKRVSTLSPQSASRYNRSISWLHPVAA